MSQEVTQFTPVAGIEQFDAGRSPEETDHTISDKAFSPVVNDPSMVYEDAKTETDSEAYQSRDIKDMKSVSGTKRDLIGVVYVGVQK